MSEPFDGDRLTDRHYLTLIVRIMLGSDGRIVHGDLIDARSGAVHRFLGWRGLVGVLRQCVVSDDGSDTDDAAIPPGETD